MMKNASIPLLTLANSNSLQEDITALFGWSMDSDLNFNVYKYVSFKCTFNTTYTMDNTPISQVQSHKVSWNHIVREFKLE